MVQRKTTKKASKKAQQKQKVTKTTTNVQGGEEGVSVGSFGSADLGKLLRLIKAVEERNGLTPIEIEFIKPSFDKADRILAKADQVEKVDKDETSEEKPVKKTPAKSASKSVNSKEKADVVKTEEV